MTKFWTQCRVQEPCPVFTEFTKKLSRILNNGYADLPSKFVLEEADARMLPIDTKSMDLIVTSPPYANNAIDYKRAHKFSLVWFGYNISYLKELRKKYLGSDSTSGELESDLPSLLQSMVKKLMRISRKKGEALKHYFLQMRTALSEMYRVLKPNRACVVVVAPSRLSGLEVKTHEYLAEIGESIGFELVHIASRTIHRDSRMLPKSHFNNGSQIEARMHDEFVIGLWKP